MNNFEIEKTTTEIIEKIKEESDEPYRPTTPKGMELEADEAKFVTLMNECWSENPNSRPEFLKIVKKVKSLLGGKYVYFLKKKNFSTFIQTIR